MKIVRRQFLHFAAASTAVFASPYVVRAQEQASKIGVAPPRSARDRLEEALARIADPKGEGARACLTVYSQAAHNAAEAADARARAGITLGPLDGAIINIKDLFDVAGEPTQAGSKVLVDAPPASSMRRLCVGFAPQARRLSPRPTWSNSLFPVSASIRITARPAIRRTARAFLAALLRAQR